MCYPPPVLLSCFFSNLTSPSPYLYMDSLGLLTKADPGKPIPLPAGHQGCPPSKVLGRAILVRGVAKLVRRLDAENDCTSTGSIGMILCLPKVENLKWVKYLPIWSMYGIGIVT